jgi:hypothetical protein
VAQGGAELGLALEAPGVDVVALAQVHALDGHVAIEPLVVGQVDGGHPTDPEPLEHAVSTREQGPGGASRHHSSSIQCKDSVPIQLLA